MNEKWTYSWWTPMPAENASPNTFRLIKPQKYFPQADVKFLVGSKTESFARRKFTGQFPETIWNFKNIIPRPMVE